MDTENMTIGDVARRLGIPAWKVRRLFERGVLPPARRVGIWRVISTKELPKVEKALQEAGYLTSVNK